MKRFIRRSLRILPLLLLTLAIVFWCISYWKVVSYRHHWGTDPYRAVIELSSGGGRISAWYMSNTPVDGLMPEGGWSVRDADFSTAYPSVFEFRFERSSPASGQPQIDFLALGFGYLSFSSAKSTQYAVIIPYWFIVLLLSIIPLLQLRAIRRHRRNAGKTLCPTCGYDLRATPTRCPECGTAAA